MKQKKILQDGTIYTFASFGVIISNFFFHAIAGKTLISTDYGTISGLFGLFGIIAFGCVSLQTKTTELTSRLLAKGKIKEYEILRKSWIRKTTIIGLILTLGLMPFSKEANTIFHASSWQWLLFVPTFAVNIPLSAVRGFLQGSQKYKALSWNFVLESLLKLLLTIIALSLGLGLSGVISALVISQIPSLIQGLILTKNTPHNKFDDKKIEENKFKTPYWIILIYFGLFALWFNLDMVLIQFLRPEIAGSYSIASKLGQLVLFAGANIGTFIFPILITNLEQNKSNIKIHITSLVLILLITCIGTLTLYFFRGWFINLLFGNQYIEAEKYLPYLCMYGGIIALTHYITHWLFTIGQKGFIWILLVGTTVQFILFYQSLQEDIIQSLTIILWSSVINMLLILICLIFSRKKSCTNPSSS